ncbi:MAG TPA: PLDc N-terminal domain-containing protein, partial [Thermomonas sp.]|nr:PLDc N-terminal domain-containing protein [Thermomonas sp.]
MEYWLRLWYGLEQLPHLRAWLTAGWVVYLLGLGGWIVLQKREPAATLSWLISLAALPYIGFLIYYVLGPQRIVRHRARRQRHYARLPREETGSDDESAELRTLALTTTGLPPSTACEVRLLVDGGHKYPALLAAIAQAREHIHLEYYIYNPDRTGGALLEALVERARAGVKVRLLVDAMGWRNVMIASAVATAGVAVAIWLIARDDPSERGYESYFAHGTGGAKGGSVRADLKTVFAYRNTWLLCVVPGAFSGIVLMFAGLWGVPFLTTHYGYSTTEAASLCSLLLVSWSVASIAYGP